MGAADVVVRALQYLALLPLLGLCAFAVHAPRAAAAALPRRASLVLIGVGLVAGAASLLVLAARMSGALAAALDPPTLWSVVRETDAGRAWAVRMAALALAAALAGRGGRVAPLICAAVATATLAWGGHGAADEGLFGWVHLAADIVHLLAAGVWVGALAAFVCLIARPQARAATADALVAFSGVGSAAAAALVASGLVNAAKLVDWRPWPVLTTSAWGRLMLVKLVLFGAMLALAAANRFALAPGLRAGGHPAAIRRSLLAEMALAAAVLLIVSVLGTLSPPAS